MHPSSASAPSICARAPFKMSGICSGCSNGQLDFVQTLRSKMLGRKIRASGRTIVDEQGGMMLADSAEIVEEDAEMKATEIRAQWGVN